MSSAYVKSPEKTPVNDMGRLMDAALDRGAAGALARHLGRIVAAASASASGLAVRSAVRCRRRPGRVRCPGHLLVRRQDVPSEIQWGCPVCSDRGIIHNWRRTPWDLSGLDRDPEDDPWEVVLPEPEYRAVEGLLTLEPQAERIVMGARHTDDGMVLAGSPTELDRLLDDIAVAAGRGGRDRDPLLERALARVQRALARRR